jgi:hypothetical protein
MTLMDRAAWAGLALALYVGFAGCGTPGAPQPPSLNLADPVADLAATRAGNNVTLTWTMTKRNTDKTAVKAGATTRICRREGAGECKPIAGVEAVTPGKSGTYTETLPDALASGEPRPVSYGVELLNKRGRSAGLSNMPMVLAGAAPGAIADLKAEVRKQGVVLNWTADGETVPVRLERRLLTPPAAKAAHEGPLPAVPEPVHQLFLVEKGVEQGRAIDESAHFSESYEYRAQRVARVEVDGKVLELAGELSAPLEVDVKDVFPPAVPTGLVAVSSAGGEGVGPSIDLNWQPNTDADLAGYIIYRREHDGQWQQVSPAMASVEPAFHDAQVRPGHSYEYAVSALGKNGRQSERSAAAQESVPQQ